MTPPGTPQAPQDAAAPEAGVEPPATPARANGQPEKERQTPPAGEESLLEWAMCLPTSLQLFIAALAIFAAALFARAVVLLDRGPTTTFSLSHFGFFGILGSVALSLVFGIVFHFSRRSLWIRTLAPFGIVASYASTLLMVTSVLTATRQPMAPDNIVVPGRPIYELPPIEIAHPIYFENGQSELVPNLAKYYRQMALAIATCNNVEVKLVGYASSATFRQDDVGQRNMLLANDRARFVGNIFRVAKVNSVQPQEWTSALDMERARGIKDRPTEETRSLLREMLNRRVDLQMKLDTDCLRPTAGE